MRKCYILTTAQVSCQSPLSHDWFVSPSFPAHGLARAQEPDVKAFVTGGEARRLSRLLKRAVCTSLTALRQAGIGMPDAIMTGTGMGCMENSEKFLTDICRNGERLLKPTLFMQSTHNTISSLIAIMLKCHGYNMTYSHRGTSFESALFDAWLQLRAGAISTALVGCHDEMTESVWRMLQATGHRPNVMSETSVSMVLSDKCGGNHCVEVEEIVPMHSAGPEEMVRLLLSWNADAVMTGLSGDPANDMPYREIARLMPADTPMLRYKHIFGEGYSASAAGVAAAAECLSRNVIPDYMRVIPAGHDGKAESLAFVNHSDNRAWYAIKLSLNKL